MIFLSQWRHFEIKSVLQLIRSTSDFKIRYFLVEHKLHLFES